MFGQGINTLINFVFMPYMARSLSYEDYGSYGQTLVVIGLFAGVFSFGLSQIVYIFFSQDNESNKHVLTNNLLITLLSSITAYAIILSFSNILAGVMGNQLIQKLIKIYGFSLLFSPINASFHSNYIYQNKVKISIFILILVNLLRISLVILVIGIYNDIVLVFYVLTFISLLETLFHLVASKNYLKKTFDFKSMRSQLKTGFPIGLTSLFGIGIIYSDSVMVSNLLGVKEYAVYRNGAFEVPFISTIYGSIAAIILPEISKLWVNRNNSDIIKLKKKVITNTVSIIYPIVFFLFFNSKDIIVLYLGSNYEKSAIIFSVFNLTLLYRVNDYTDILIIANKTKFILLSNLLVFIINLILNYILIQLLGSSVGAAYATVISIFFLAFILLKKSLKYLNCKFKDIVEIEKILKLSILSITSVIAIKFLFFQIENSLIRLFLNFFSYTFVTIVIINYVNKDVLLLIKNKILKHKK